jgi:hypothetical protein
VVEATGTTANVERAVSSVEGLGTVVLAAPVDAELVQVSGYADIHVRGLTVVGIPWATGLAHAPANLVDWALARLAHAQDGEPAPSAPWFRCDP